MKFKINLSLLQYRKYIISRDLKKLKYKPYSGLADVDIIKVSFAQQRI